MSSRSYYQCATSYGLTTVIRDTADCPVIDIDISSNVISIFLGEVTTTLEPDQLTLTASTQKSFLLTAQ